MNKRREVLLRYNVRDTKPLLGYKLTLDQALTALNKLEKEKINGAYKQGYHDALNGRPYKVKI